MAKQFCFPVKELPFIDDDGPLQLTEKDTEIHSILGPDYLGLSLILYKCKYVAKGVGTCRKTKLTVIKLPTATFWDFSTYEAAWRYVSNYFDLFRKCNVCFYSNDRFDCVWFQSYAFIKKMMKLDEVLYLTVVSSEVCNIDKPLLINWIKFSARVQRYTQHLKLDSILLHKKNSTLMIWCDLRLWQKLRQRSGRL